MSSDDAFASVFYSLIFSSTVIIWLKCPPMAFIVVFKFPSIALIDFIVRSHPMVKNITTDTKEKNAEMIEIGTGTQIRELCSSMYSKLKEIKTMLSNS